MLLTVTDEQAVAAAIRAWAARRGYRAACADIALLDKVRAEIQASFQEGTIDPDLYRTQLAPLCRGTTAEVPAPKRILMVAVPRPAHTVRFALAGRCVDAVLPPTYVRYSALPEAVRDDLREAVPGEHFRLGILNAPLKALAARIGLVRYGRNNLTYVEGLGSYFQLVGCTTDALLEPAPEQPPRALPACENCGACAACCPGGAIREDRFPLNAARCLTLFSENEGSWPAFFCASMLECLVGCLTCQQVCPENAGLFTIEPAGVCFAEEETAAIVAGGRRDGPVWDRIREKLASLRLVHYEPVITRNLRALLGFR
jgi:epoxyqueuosine reductase